MCYIEEMEAGLCRLHRLVCMLQESHVFCAGYKCFHELLGNEVSERSRFILMQLC